MTIPDTFRFALSTQLSLRHGLPESHLERCINGKRGAHGLSWYVIVVPLVKMLIGLSDARQDVILKVKLLKML